MDPKLIPGTLSVRLEYTLDGTPVHCSSVTCGKHENDDMWSFFSQPLYNVHTQSIDLHWTQLTFHYLGCCLAPANCIEKQTFFHVLIPLFFLDLVRGLAHSKAKPNMSLISFAIQQSRQRKKWRTSFSLPSSASSILFLRFHDDVFLS